MAISIGGMLTRASSVISRNIPLRESTIRRICQEAGHQLVPLVRSKSGEHTIADFNNVYEKVLPKGSPIKATDNPNTAEAFLRQSGFQEHTVQSWMEGAQAFVISNFKAEYLFYFPIKKFSGDKAANFGVHELAHAVYQAHSLPGIAAKLTKKLLGEKLVKKMALKKSEIAGNKNLALQHLLIGNRFGTIKETEVILPQTADAKGLAEYLKTSQRRIDTDLRNAVRRVLDQKAEGKNIKALKAIKVGFEDEARAYGLGGPTAREYLGIQEGSSLSEMTSQLFSEASQAIRNEIRAQRIKQIKRAIGLKVRDYEGPSRKLYVINPTPRSSTPQEISERLKNCSFKQIKGVYKKPVTSLETQA